MLPKWVKQAGKWRLLILGSLLSTGGSFLITFVVMKLMFGGMNSISIIMGLLIPALSGTPVLYVLLSLLFKFDETRQDLEHLAITDELTQAYNRRYLFLQMEKEIERCRRYGNVFSLIMIDCDNFKALNDTHGHPSGDAFLRDLSNLIHVRIRKADLFARIGGDEFVILLPNTNATQANVLARQMHALFDTLEVWHARENPVTISMGVTTWNPLVQTPEELLETLDQALYRAKHAGKNQVAYL